MAGLLALFGTGLLGCSIDAQLHGQELSNLKQRAGRLLSEGRLEEALDPIDRALALPPSDSPDPTRPSHVDLLLLKSEVLRELGRTEEAEASIARARAFDPYRPELVLYDAMSKLDDGDSAGALAAIDAAVDRSPSNPPLLLERALLLLNISDPAGAARDFADVIAMVEYSGRGAKDPPRELGIAYLGHAVASAAANPGEGAESFLKGLEIVGNSAVPMLGQFATGGYDRTVAELVDSAVALEPDHPGLVPVQASLLLAAGDAAGALAHVQRRLEQEHDGDTRIGLFMIAAQAEDMRGSPTDAIPWLRRALDEDPANVVVIEILAMHVAQTGAGTADVQDLRSRIEAATLVIEDPKDLQRLEDLARRVEGSPNA